MRRPSPALRWIAALASLVVFTLLLHATNVREVSRLLHDVGPKAFLVLLPFAVIVVVDAWGWQRLIAVLREPPALVDLVRTRISLEAMILTLPGGGLIAESAAPALLVSRCKLPLRDAIVAVAARTWVTLRANALYLAAGARVGYSLLQAQSQRIVGRAGLGIVALFLPLLPLGASLALEATFSRGSFAHALHRKLSAFPGRLGTFFAQRGRAFDEVDEDFQRFGHGGKAMTPATIAYLVAWLLESVESWLILRLLGVSLSFFAVLGFEPALSLLRSAAFFLPAGLGAQDVGYVALLGGGPQAFAFIALKRIKELFWAAIGWTLLVTGKSAHPVTRPAEACA